MGGTVRAVWLMARGDYTVTRGGRQPRTDLVYERSEPKSFEVSSFEITNPEQRPDLAVRDLSAQVDGRMRKARDDGASSGPWVSVFICNRFQSGVKPGLRKANADWEAVETPVYTEDCRAVGKAAAALDEREVFQALEGSAELAAVTGKVPADAAEATAELPLSGAARGYSATPAVGGEAALKRETGMANAAPANKRAPVPATRSTALPEGRPGPHEATYLP